MTSAGVQKAHEEHDPREGSPYRVFKDEHGTPMPVEAAFPVRPPKAGFDWVVNGWMRLYAVSSMASVSDYVRDVPVPQTAKIYPYMTSSFEDGVEYAVLIEHFRPAWGRLLFGKNRLLTYEQYKGDEPQAWMAGDGWQQTAVRSSADYDYSQHLWSLRFKTLEDAGKNRVESTHTFFQRRSG